MPLRMLEPLEPRVLLSSPVSVGGRVHPLAESVVGRARRAKAKVVVNYRATTLFPTAAGATWSYRQGTEVVDVAVSGTPTTVKGVTTAQLLTTRGGDTLATETYTLADHGVRMTQRTLQSPGASDQELFPGGVPVLPFAVRTGAKAAFWLKWQGVADSADFAWTGTDARKLAVMGMQTLTVPAGSYKAMHVRETRTATQAQTQSGPLSVRLTTTTDAYYAPGLGLVRSVVTTKRVAYYNSVAVESTTQRKVTDLLATNLTYIPPRPDLVAKVRGSDAVDARPSQKVPLNITLRNHGQESARPSTVTLYLSTDRTVDFSDPAVAAARVKAMVPGRSLVRRLALQLPRRPGTYYVAAFADAAQEVDEISRDNNWSATVRINAAKGK